MWISQKSIEKLELSLQQDKNEEYFTRRPIHIFDYISLISSWNKKYFRQILEKNQTGINQNTFFLRNRAVYGKSTINIVERYRPQIIRQLRISCWITKAKNAHKMFVKLTAFPPQQWLHKRASILRYNYIACLVLSTKCCFYNLFAQNTTACHTFCVQICQLILNYLQYPLCAEY